MIRWFFRLFRRRKPWSQPGHSFVSPPRQHRDYVFDAQKFRRFKS